MKRAHILEGILVLLILLGLGYLTIPAFLANQNINTPQNFPDPNFRVAVERFMQVTPGGRFTARDAAEKTGELNCSRQTIKSMKGIEFFVGINLLDCGDNGIEELDLSRNHDLVELRCSGNRLSSIDFSANPLLEYISIGGNCLTHLDLRPVPDLLYLVCNGNQLDHLDLSHNPELNILDCADNQLTELDLSHNPLLVEVDCRENQLKRLDARPFEHLLNLSVSSNQLTELLLGMHPNLQKVDCGNNHVASIDVTRCPRLNSVDAANNDFTSVPDFSNNPELLYVDLRQNELAEDDCETIRPLHQRLGDLAYIDEGPTRKGFLFSPQQGNRALDCR